MYNFILFYLTISLKYNRDGNYGDLMDVGLPPASPSEKDTDVQVRQLFAIMYPLK